MEDVQAEIEEEEEEEDDEDDVEMDFGDDTGSEDTSETEDEAVENDIENEARDSDEMWQDEDEEDEENLVENEDENGEEDEENEGDQEVGGGMIWQVSISPQPIPVISLMDIYFRELSMLVTSTPGRRKKLMRMKQKVGDLYNSDCQLHRLVSFLVQIPIVRTDSENEPDAQSEEECVHFLLLYFLSYLHSQSCARSRHHRCPNWYPTGPRRYLWACSYFCKWSR
jgi:hypothetical protein